MGVGAGGVGDGGVGVGTGGVGVDPSLLTHPNWTVSRDPPWNEEDLTCTFLNCNS